VIESEDASRAWVAQHGGSFSFLIAAHMTFSRIFDDYFDDPAEDSSERLDTAGRRLTDAAALLDKADPLPDSTAQRLLRDILDRVQCTVALAPDATRGVDVVRLKTRTDADLVRLAERIRTVA
jgi:hypothetical protein